MKKTSASGRLQELYGLYKAGKLMLEEFELLKKHIIEAYDGPIEVSPTYIAPAEEHEAGFLGTQNAISNMTDHKHVERLGGKIWVESEVGKDATTIKGLFNLFCFN